MFQLIYKAAYQPQVSATEFLSNKRHRNLFETFIFLQAYLNPCQAQPNNKDFTQLRRQQQHITSIHPALKVTADVLSPILY